MSTYLTTNKSGELVKIGTLYDIRLEFIPSRFERQDGRVYCANGICPTILTCFNAAMRGLFLIEYAL